jgi:hypothetical protein
MLPEDGGNTRQTLLLGAMAIGVLLLVELTHWSRGGGIYSIVSAFHAVNAHAPAVDVDDMGLQAPAGFVFCAAALGICRLFNVNLRNRWVQFTGIIGLVVGSVTLTVIAQERIIGGYLAAHGYSRCAARDHQVGSGKHHTWFYDYVLKPADCPEE